MRMSQHVIDEIVRELDRLPDQEQRHVLQFVRALAEATPAGVPGHELVGLVGLIPAADLAEMAQAIEEGCEQVDEREW
jgi:hypothetical protein